MALEQYSRRTAPSTFGGIPNGFIRTVVDSVALLVMIKQRKIR
jgi:hypothetical protein